MSDRRPRTLEEEEEMTASPQFTRLLIIAYLTAAGVGLLCGVAWVAYHLLWMHGTG